MDESKTGTYLGIGALVLAVAGALIYHEYFRASAKPVQPPVVATAEKPAMDIPGKAAPTPGLTTEQAEAMLRDRAKELSTRKESASWFEKENIIRRITAAVDIIAQGDNPKDSLDFLSPHKEFSVMKKKGKIYLNPKSYARYDTVGNVIESMNTATTVKAFQELKPAFEAACKEQGCWQRGFQDTLIRAIVELLQAPVVEEDIELKKKVVTYLMADSKLEHLSAAQKHLIRMGPKNTVKIQTKLREIALALGASEDQLPKQHTYSSKS